MRFRRRRWAVVLLAIPFLVSCQPGKPAPFPEDPVEERALWPGSPGLLRVVRSGELRVGTSGEQPPLSMTASNGQLLGLDIAMMRILAETMEVEARFVRMPFGRLLDALDAGEVDVVASGMTITPERSARVRFVGPYYDSGKALLTRSQELAVLGSISELDAPRRRVAVLAGSTSEAYAREKLARAERVALETLEEAVRATVSGEVDALLADRETCAVAVLRFPEAGLLSSGQTFTVEPMGIAVDRDDPRLAELLEVYLEALEEHGALERARAFWFGDSSWVGSLQ